MNPYRSPLLITPNFKEKEYVRITPYQAEWDCLHFAARQIRRGRLWHSETCEHELALVVLGGTCKVTSNIGNWRNIGRRPNVFSGMPYTLYLPPATRFTVETTSDLLDIAYGWCIAKDAYPARLIPPEEVEVEIRGGENATCQINNMIPPGFPCSRLVVVEVYTPAGNWSSYPPHKHDQRRLNKQGVLIEADLDEIYFYKMERPEGVAYQRIYTTDRTLDELILVGDSHLVLSTKGYHPVVAAPGHHCYYLNVLAGSDQSLLASDDPDHAWIKDTWKEKDPRLPLVHLEMETEIK